MSESHNNDEKSQTRVYRAPPGGPDWYDEERDELSFVQLLNVLLRHRWKVLGVPVFLVTALFSWTALQPPGYTADATFMPEAGGASGQLSQLSGVASQFGIEVPTGQTGQSPQFYADLVTSRRLLEEAVTSNYRRAADTAAPTSMVGASATDATGAVARQGESFASDSTGLSLVELYDIEAPSRSVAVAKAARRLEAAVSVSPNTATGVVELSVTTQWPAVSMQIADGLIKLVNQFNNRVRQSQASARAEFVRGRLREARKELRGAEDRLETFLQRNVGWQQSPELRFRHDRLQRRVSRKQQVYTSLATRYEQARIAEVKSTPVVTTVTRPRVPAQPDGRRLPLKAALGLVLGGMLGVFWAFGSEFAKNAPEKNTEEYREFVSLKEDAARDVKRVGRRLCRLIEGVGDRKG